MSVGALATIEDPIADRTQAVRGFTSAGKFHISCVGGMCEVSYLMRGRLHPLKRGYMSHMWEISYLMRGRFHNLREVSYLMRGRFHILLEVSYLMCGRFHISWGEDFVLQS